MMRKLVLGVVVAVVMTSPLRAELKYTMHMEAHKSTVPVTPDPVMGGMADTIIQMMLPNGPFNTVTTVGDKGIRMDPDKAAVGVPQGAWMLIKADGSMYVINPADKTYWKSAVPDLSQMFPTPPTITTKATQESATIAGVKADKVEVELKLPIPIPPGVTPPPGMATDLVFTQELWTTKAFDKYKTPLALMGKSQGMMALGGDKIASLGFALKTVMRGPMYGDQEIEVVVTKIGEEAAPADAFEIPAGFKEVPPRIGGLK
jgi:hypothetical protein